VGKKAKKSELEQTKEYVAFLRKRLDSKNYKAAVSAEEYAETQEQYKKAKFCLRVMGGEPGR
jgi:hypothetical protein